MGTCEDGQRFNTAALRKCPCELWGAELACEFTELQLTAAIPTLTTATCLDCLRSMARGTLVMWMLLGRLASAEPVHWHAPIGCPDADDVAARVARRLPRTSAARAPIDVTVHEDADGFVAEIGGERTLTSTSCGELADAVALIVARAVLDEPEPAAAVVVARPAPARAPASDIGIAARISGTSMIGAQPSLSGGVELAVPLHWRELMIEPAIAAAASTTARIAAISATTPTAAVAVALRTATLRIGWRPSRLPLRAWVAADLGELRGDGLMVAAATHGEALWAAAGAGIAGIWRLRPNVAVVGTAELIVPITRPTFELVTGEQLYRPEIAAGRIALGLEVGWP
jgi:hypothetical protein